MFQAHFPKVFEYICQKQNIGFQVEPALVVKVFTLKGGVHILGMLVILVFYTF